MAFGKSARKKSLRFLFTRAALASTLFVLVLPSVFAGGQGGSRPGAASADYLNTASAMPIVKEKITLQLVTEKGVTQGPADRLWFWKWAEREMNIHFDVIQLDSVSAREKQNLMLAANELPDIFFANPVFTTSDILQYGQKEKQLIPLNDLIEKYAPNLSVYFDQHPSARAQSTCPDGNIYFLPGVNLPPQTYQSTRSWIHTGWLNALGLKMPGTLDELYDTLVAFRDRDPNGNGKKDEIPMAGGANAMNPFVIISAAMGFPEANPISPVVTQNGNVGLFAASPVYGEYLKYINRLFGEGLLDNEFYTNTMIILRGKGAELRVGVHTDGAPFQMTPAEKDWRQYEAISPLTSQWNNTRMWLANPEIIVGRFAITRACKYPEAAARFADYFYTEQGPVYAYYGPPKGHPDLMGTHEGWYFDSNGAVVFDRTGTDLTNDEEYRHGYISARGQPNFGNNDFQTGIENIAGQKFVFSPNARAWRDSMDTYVKPYEIPRYPVVYFDNAENDRVLELASTVTDYMTMMEARFITGAEPLSNIPAYLERLKSLGAAELEKIYQDAYAVYNRNLSHYN